MQAIYKIIPPKGEPPLQEAGEIAVTTYYEPQAGLSRINKFSDSPCPRGCVRVRAYSKGRHISEATE